MEAFLSHKCLVFFNYSMHTLDEVWSLVSPEATQYPGLKSAVISQARKLHSRP